MHSPDHSTKGTPLIGTRSCGNDLWLLVRTRFQGLFHPPRRGAFHLSLTVLVRYRSLKVFSLGEWSPQLPTRFHVPRGTQDTDGAVCFVRYGILTLSGAAFQRLRVKRPTRLSVLQPQSIVKCSGLGCSRFARHYYGNLMLISCRRATEMFQFTRCPPTCLCVQQAVSRHHSGWVAPFGYSRLIACLQLPLNVSPVSASFFGFQRPGIPHVLCVACLYFDMCSCASLSSSLFRSLRRIFLCFSFALGQN